jgi:beta-glucanase (GH16 family)
LKDDKAEVRRGAILEMVDPTGRRVAQHHHADNNALDFTANPNLGWDSGIDLTADYHMFGVDWSKDRLACLVDGKVTQETKTKVPNVPLYAILNLAVAGNWVGQPDASTPWPAGMIVDYVKVWSQA